MGLPENKKIKLANKYPKGKRNKITDVPGVTVGQVTLEDEEKYIHTGVTAILPHQGNLFQDKVAAGVSIINAFGKSAGLIQIQELGTIETPIIMTNTFGVGTALNALTRYMLSQNEDIGATTSTVNCVVTECNDGVLNDIRGMHITEDHVCRALETAEKDFEEGACGSGTGMVCMGLKGGIGSASRVVKIKEKEYTVGALLMSNFGSYGNLKIGGKPVDVPAIDEEGKPAEPEKDKGSVIIVLATDLPLSSRQLNRVAKRATVGLARVGSYLGNGSGDIAVAFSTANRIPHYCEEGLVDIRMTHDDALDCVFEAVAEAVEEAVISSLYHAKTTSGIRGKVIHSVCEYL